MDATTIQDVAAHAKVVPSTVSKVLNDYKGVSLKTRERVLLAVKELNYRPNRAARSFRTGTTQTASVFIPQIGSDFFDRLVTAIDDELGANDYDAALFPLLNERRLERYRSPDALPYQADGVIMASLNPDWLFPNAELPVKLPAVLVDAYHADYDTVTVDNAGGAYAATQHLLEKPGELFMVTLPIGRNTFASGVFIERLKGFKRALKDAGKRFSQRTVLEVGFSTEGARGALRDIMSQAKAPFNIFASCDLLAKGILEEAQNLSLNIGTDLRVVGFDNQHWAEGLNLSTVRQPIEALGREAVKLLQARLKEPERELVHKEFKPELIIRGSSYKEAS